MSIPDEDRLDHDSEDSESLDRDSAESGWPKLILSSIFGPVIGCLLFVVLLVATDFVMTNFDFGFVASNEDAPYEGPFDDPFDLFLVMHILNIVYTLTPLPMLKRLRPSSSLRRRLVFSLLCFLASFVLSVVVWAGARAIVGSEPRVPAEEVSHSFAEAFASLPTEWEHIALLIQAPALLFTLLVSGDRTSPTVSFTENWRNSFVVNVLLSVVVGVSGRSPIAFFVVFALVAFLVIRSHEWGERLSLKCVNRLSPAVRNA